MGVVDPLFFDLLVFPFIAPFSLLDEDGETGWQEERKDQVISDI